MEERQKRTIIEADIRGLRETHTHTHTYIHTQNNFFLIFVHARVGSFFFLLLLYHDMEWMDMFLDYLGTYLAPLVFVFFFIFLYSLFKLFGNVVDG